MTREMYRLQQNSQYRLAGKQKPPQHHDQGLTSLFPPLWAGDTISMIIDVDVHASVIVSVLIATL